jgi:hypothetical protein
MNSEARPAIRRRGNGEFYVALTFNELILKGYIIGIHHLD